MYHLNFFLFFNKNFFFYKYQFNVFFNLVQHCVMLKRSFLILDDLSNKSQLNVYNYFLNKELGFLYKYLTFIYSKSKTKKLFIIYLNKIISKKKIHFLIFLNEDFFILNKVVFSRINLPKIGFVSTKIAYNFLDYCIYIPTNNYIHQIYFFSFFYNLIKLSYNNNIITQNLFFKNFI